MYYLVKNEDRLFNYEKEELVKQGILELSDENRVREALLDEILDSGFDFDDAIETLLNIIPDNELETVAENFALYLFDNKKDAEDIINEYIKERF